MRKVCKDQTCSVFKQEGESFCDIRNTFKKGQNTQQRHRLEPLPHPHPPPHRIDVSGHICIQAFKGKCGCQCVSGAFTSILNAVKDCFVWGCLHTFVNVDNITIQWLLMLFSYEKNKKVESIWTYQRNCTLWDRNQNKGNEGRNCIQYLCPDFRLVL